MLLHGQKPAAKVRMVFFGSCASSLIHGRGQFTASPSGLLLAVLLDGTELLPQSLPRLSAASMGESTEREKQAASSPVRQPATARATGPGPPPGARWC